MPDWLIADLRAVTRSGRGLETTRDSQCNVS